jgi:predicted dehydrogenase
MEMKDISRRKFLLDSSKLAATVGLMGVPVAESFASKKRVGANDKVQIALVGIRGVNWANLMSHNKLSETECVAFCDIDDNVMKQRTTEFEKLTGKKVQAYTDYRKLLENKEIDAVLIGTPDHWHAIQMIEACSAGKDVYVEKPISCTIEESLAMVKAAQRYGRVVQVGQQQRSGLHWQAVMEYVQSGKLGKIRSAKCWISNGNRGELAQISEEAIPAGVNYDMWLGPAPQRPFHKYRFHGSFRFFWDYAGGLMTDWGVHLLDIAFGALNVKTPKSVVASGGKFAYPTDMMETPDTMMAIYEFDKFLISWEHTFGSYRGLFDKHHGVAFYGENGYLVADRGGWQVFPEVDDKSPEPIKKYKLEMLPLQKVTVDDRDLHAANFVQCIKTRQKPICDIETGANVAINSHLGNIAYRLGRKVYWDATTNTFPKDAEAQAMTKRIYRKPWTLPTV